MGHHHICTVITWLTLIYYTSAASKLATMCQTQAVSLREGDDISIFSPTVASAESVDCSLQIDGIPENSHAELRKYNINLPCVQEYNCYFGWCSTGASYVQIDGVETKLCQPTTQFSIIHYKNYTGPITIKLYSDNYKPEFSFSLKFRVLSAERIPTTTTTTTTTTPRPTTTTTPRPTITTTVTTTTSKPTRTTRSTTPATTKTTKTTTIPTTTRPTTTETTTTTSITTATTKTTPTTTAATKTTPITTATTKTTPTTTAAPATTPTTPASTTTIITTPTTTTHKTLISMTSHSTTSPTTAVTTPNPSDNEVSTPLTTLLLESTTASTPIVDQQETRPAGSQAVTHSYKDTADRLVGRSREPNPATHQRGSPTTLLPESVTEANVDREKEDDDNFTMYIAASVGAGVVLIVIVIVAVIFLLRNRNKSRHEKEIPEGNGAKPANPDEPNRKSLISVGNTYELVASDDPSPYYAEPEPGSLSTTFTQQPNQRDSLIMNSNSERVPGL